MSDTKPYVIPKQLVWEAYQRVKANQGAAGVDGESLAMFEQDLKGNLYKVWNRMSSGSYFPPPVRLVEIPKDDGGIRPLGIPTVADRVAQTVVKMVLEPSVDPQFHPDSYGYRPGKSALDAVGTTRQRCWSADWVIDLDIKGFFDSIPHDLVERAVAHHTDIPWVRLYVSRWLRAPVQRPDGTREQRTKGTPQGGVISPLLANLFLHYTFDTWMRRTYPGVLFERYADDAIVHCKTEQQAKAVLAAIRGRFEQCGLALHPTKTRIVYCKDANRPGEYELKFTDAHGKPVANPALIGRTSGTLDGQLPTSHEVDALGAALHFGFLDRNPGYEEGVNAEGWRIITADTELFIWPIDLETGHVTVTTGGLVRTLSGGFQIEDDELEIRSPLELHMPGAPSADADVLAAIYDVCCNSSRTPGANRTAGQIRTAIHWLAKSWKNTNSIRSR